MGLHVYSGSPEADIGMAQNIYFFSSDQHASERLPFSTNRSSDIYGGPSCGCTGPRGRREAPANVGSTRILAKPSEAIKSSDYV